MALINILARSSLATINVLAPERYDPRRALAANATDTVLLGDVVAIIRRVVQPSADLGSCVVLDTSDAREGIVISRRLPVQGTEIRSAKKALATRDVIVSRLRPYLRQVAFVDEEIPYAGGACLVCSTEFFVLRSPNNSSIAFLVPFLLSRQVQDVLAAAQEGGHHPRCDVSTLLTLPLPVSFLDERETVSKTVEEAIRFYRKSERGIQQMTTAAEEALS